MRRHQRLSLQRLVNEWRFLVTNGGRGNLEFKEPPEINGRDLRRREKWPELESIFSNDPTLGEYYAEAYANAERAAIARYVVGMYTTRKECRQTASTSLSRDVEAALAQGYTSVAKALRYAALEMLSPGDSRQPQRPRN